MKKHTQKTISGGPDVGISRQGFLSSYYNSAPKQRNKWTGKQ